MVAVVSEILLVGTWKLLSREEVTSGGQRRIDPILGANPVAYLMYDAAGHFAVQFMRRERESRENMGTESTVAGYDAYFGRYSVADNTVTQEIVGALSPEDVGKIVTRRFRIRGDELIIDLETTAHDGEPVTRTLRWQRIA